ncbi:MAG TPA: hypothetical protein VJX68_08925 [Candidatus Binatus sp.]|uniref:hypothetical protein n=1 Tax=Candidatus Binatus sp. TaxID=2811406 RepID=UPI002B485958|nr:hypothetical protein [Candidatus Binatus sp.]HKN13307.1 hypothetical protein [Candidatus Binatus sp.]
MPRSVFILILALTAVGVASCSTSTPAPKPGPPPFLARSTTLAVTNGIKVLTNVAMPQGFAPISTRPPIWLQNGEEIGVVGTQAGHTIMYGLGGAGWRTGRVLVAETGPAAAEEGTLADLAVSPNGLTLATAMVAPGGDRVDVIIRDLIATGPGNAISDFNGRYDSISMSWLNDSTIALALRAHPEPPEESGVSDEAPKSDSDQPDAEPPPTRSDGLQLIVITGAASVAPLKLSCPMSPLSWSAHGVYAVGQGDAGAPPVIIDRRASTCTRFHVREPIHVLDWDKDDEGSFLYVGPDPTRHTIGVFKYNIATGAEHLMGVSTGAASFAAGSDTVTLGNRDLTFARAIERPEKSIPAQVAVAQSDQSQVDVKSLGFDTWPEMLARSTMAYSKGADEAAMQIYAPSLPVPWRKIVTYSLHYDSAFLLAEGPAQGTVTMSWSLRGRWLAFLDGDATAGTVMTVIEPPR